MSCHKGRRREGSHVEQKNMSKSHHVLPAVAVVLAVLVSGMACGSSTAPSGSGGIGTGTGNGGNATVMTATIDGTSFTATSASAIVRNNILAVSGALGSGTNITTLAFATTATVGTNRIAPGTGVNANYQAVSGTAASGWLASDNQGSGTVTINTLTSSRASGTFSFTLAPVSGNAAGPKSVLAGTFDLPLTQ